MAFRFNHACYGISFAFTFTCTVFTALFNNMRTLTFKAQPTNAFFATVNQMFSSSSQLPTTTERAVIKSNRLDNIVGSWEELPNSWLTVAKNAFVGWALNFRVRMLLKSAVISLVRFVALESVAPLNCTVINPFWRAILKILIPL